MTKPSSSTRGHSRFIPREEVGAVTRWQFGAVGDPFDPVVSEAAELPSPSLEDDVQDQHAFEEAMEQAFTQGEAQGQAATALQWQQKLDDYIAGEGREAALELQQLAQNFERGLVQAQKDMAQRVLELACEVARQVVRRELQTDHQALLVVVDEALGELVNETLPTVVRLNPADDARLGEVLRSHAAERSIQWITDKEVSPGGCQIEQAGKRIDGSLQTRWQRALATLGLDSRWTPEDENEPG